MNIGFLLGHPTQFEGPFFRHAAASGGAKLTVLYVRGDTSGSIYDPELERAVGWGVDLLGGYEHRMLPARARLRWLWSELHPQRYDWLIINGYTTWPYLCALAIARLRGIRTGLRIDSVLYNASSAGRRLWKRAALSVLSKLFDRFFATGTLARDYLEYFGVESSRIAYFPYNVDTAYFASRAMRRRGARAALRQQLGIPADARVVLAVAKFNAREAPWDLLRALDGLDRADVWTVMAGDGELRGALEAQASERVVFPGYVPYAELVDYYAAADVFVHAAANEPWGVSVHEAIACGLPVVASSRVGAAYDLIVRGENGFMYPSGNASELRSRLLAALEGLSAAQVSRANRDVLARWNYERAWRDILAAVRA